MIATEIVNVITLSPAYTGFCYILARHHRLAPVATYFHSLRELKFLIFQYKRNFQTIWNAVFGEDFALAGFDAGFNDCNSELLVCQEILCSS